MPTELQKMYRKWSTANIRTRLRNDRERLEWWKTKTTQTHKIAESVQLYSDHINAMEAVLASRAHGGCGKAA
jgi:hypothetical protein